MRFGVRSLAKNPGFSALAVLSLAAGVGLTAALASVADAILFRPLPVTRPGEVVRIFSSSKDQSLGFLSYPDFADLRAGATTLSGLVAQSQVLIAVDGDGGVPAQVRMGLAVTPDYFNVLGVPTSRGRTFRPGDEREPVVVLAYAFWASRNDRDQRTIRLGGVIFTVIGVAAKDFGLDRFGHEDFYVPMDVYAAGLLPVTGRPLEDRARRYLSVYGRLARGTTVEQAGAEVAALAGRLESACPESNRGWRAIVLTELQARTHGGGPIPALAALLLGAAALILAIACANVSGLLLMRGEARIRELAMRMALGASPARLFAQSLTESIILALAGGLTGVPLAWAATKLLAKFATLPTDMPFAIAARIDGRVAGLALCVTLVAAVACGLTPWFAARGTEVAVVLKSGGVPAGGGKTRLRSALVALQIALAVALVASGGMLAKSMLSASRLELGYRTDHVLVMTFDPAQMGYGEVRTRAFYRELLDCVRRLPGVKTAAMGQSVPLGYTRVQRQISVEGGRDPVMMWMNTVSPGYFALMHLPLAAGRGFDDNDTATSSAVAVINQEFAKFWKNPVGQRFRMDGRVLQVIGVARTAKYFSLGEAPRAYFYLPYSQNYASRMVLHVETAGDPAGIVRPALGELAKIDAGQPVSEIRALDVYFAKGAMFYARLGFLALGSFGSCGMLVALAGLYGVVSGAVMRRRREIGIRMALGAERPAVVMLVLADGAKLVLAGTTGGLAATVAARPLLARLMIGGASRPDAWALGSAALLAILASLAATAIPAWRASSIQTATALRDE